MPSILTMASIYFNGVNEGIQIGVYNGQTNYYQLQGRVSNPYINNLDESSELTRWLRLQNDRNPALNLYRRYRSDETQTLLAEMKS